MLGFLCFFQSVILSWFSLLFIPRFAAPLIMRFALSTFTQKGRSSQNLKLLLILCSRDIASKMFFKKFPRSNSKKKFFQIQGFNRKWYLAALAFQVKSTVDFAFHYFVDITIRLHFLLSQSKRNNTPSRLTYSRLILPFKIHFRQLTYL